ncbi:hypothetical protein ACS0TY_018834 [Phlomoides rotata]
MADLLPWSYSLLTASKGEMSSQAALWLLKKGLAMKGENGWQSRPTGSHPRPRSSSPVRASTKMGSSPVKFKHLLLCILLLYCLPKGPEALSPDGQALANFRTAIISSDGILQQWRPEDLDPCRWKGVKCDMKSKRVKAL